MKAITIKNLTFQFDSFDDGADQHTIHNAIDEVNAVLRQRFSDSQPQLLCTDNDFDFEIEDKDEE